jgi:hypothetical protein
MAERRMFAKTIVDSDDFLEMPLSTQALYFHLSIRADDDGFLNNPNKIMKNIGANKNDYDVLISKRYIIIFPDGICVIRHWKIHNYIQTDRYKETLYTEEKSMLVIKKNRPYTLVDTNCIQNVYSLDTMDTQVRLVKDSVGKDKLELDELNNDRFTPPTLEQVQAYCLERNNQIDAERFIDFYSSKGWMVGNNIMKDWQARVRIWEKDNNARQSMQVHNNKFNQYPQRKYSDKDYTDLEKKLLNKGL